MDLESLARDYRTAFLRYLPNRSEAAMTTGYELGRRAATGGSSLLDIVQVHHRIVAQLLLDPPAPDPGDVIEAAGEFLSEVLATFHMAHLALRDLTPPETGIERP